MAGSSWYNGDQLPGTADEICVNDGAAKPMTITSETAFDVAAFRLGVNQSRRDNTVVMNGGTLNSRSDVTVGYYKGSGGTMTQNGGSITAAGRLNIAYRGQQLRHVPHDGRNPLCRRGHRRERG